MSQFTQGLSLAARVFKGASRPAQAALRVVAESALPAEQAVQVAASQAELKGAQVGQLARLVRMHGKKRLQDAIRALDEAQEAASGATGLKVGESPVGEVLSKAKKAAVLKAQQRLKRELQRSTLLKARREGEDALRGVGVQPVVDAEDEALAQTIAQAAQVEQAVPPLKAGFAQRLLDRVTANPVETGIGVLGTGMLAADILDQAGAGDLIRPERRVRNVQDQINEWQRQVVMRARVERLQADADGNLARLAQQRPDLYNEAVYRRKFPRGAIPIGGTPDDTFARKIGMAMAMGGFDGPMPASEELSAQMGM